MTAFFYDLIFVLPVFVLAISNIMVYLDVPENTKICYAAALIILACAFSLKHIKGRLKFILPGVTFMLVFGIILVQENGMRMQFVADNFWFLWILLITLASFAAGLMIAENRKCRLAAAFFVLAVMIYLMVRGPLPDKLQSAVAFLFLVFVVADEVQRSWEKSGYTERKGHIVSVAPFIILLGLIIYLVPAPEKPYDWNFAKVIMKRISDGVKYAGRMINSGKEDYAGVMGFKENGTYFGNLYVEDETIMRLSTGSNAGRVIYLSGRIMDDFDGREWKNLNILENHDNILDAIETYTAVDIYDRKNNFDYYKRIDLNVEYDEFNTSYYFAPSKLVRFTPGSEKEGAVISGSEIKALTHLGYGTKYELSYFRMNSQNKDFRLLTDNVTPIDRESWDRGCYALNYKDDQGYSYEDYQAHIERIYEYYLPDTQLSEKAEEYLEKLSEGAESDTEVLERLDKVLSGFKYTLNPGELPEKIKSPADFVDYILFEKQEGYCTHYATTFVIMARSMGLPARFVQGFLVPLTGRQPYHVRSSMSHAWAEVYIDGLGWMQYEPTPGISYDNSWNFMPRNTEDGEKSGIVSEEKNHEDEPLPVPELEDENKTVNWRGILIPAGLIALFLLGFILADRALQRRRLKKMKPARRAAVYCRYGIRLLAVLGLKRSKGETLEEYRIRASKELFEDDGYEYEEEEKACLNFIELYENILYAKEAPAGEMLDEIREDITGVFALISERKGRLMAFLAKVGTTLN